MLNLVLASILSFTAIAQAQTADENFAQRSAEKQAADTKIFMKAYELRLEMQLQEVLNDFNENNGLAITRESLVDVPVRKKSPYVNGTDPSTAQREWVATQPQDGYICQIEIAQYSDHDYMCPLTGSPVLGMTFLCAPRSPRLGIGSLDYLEEGDILRARGSCLDKNNGEKKLSNSYSGVAEEFESAEDAEKFLKTYGN